MKINFATCYTEPGLNFDRAYSNQFWRILVKNFNVIEKNITFFEKKFKTPDFSMLIIINTIVADELVVRGPTVRRKSPDLDFAIWIPYKKTDSYEEEMAYFSQQLEKGMLYIFDKYGEDVSGIKEAIGATVQEALAHPTIYEGIPKPW